MSTVPVVIIGAGPTGLTAATLLGQYGVESLVLDRWESVYPQPRAVHLDDEVYRVLARMGAAEQFAAITRPCQGLRLLDRDMRVLAEFRRGTATGRHGYPEANMLDQPVLEDGRRFDDVAGGRFAVVTTADAAPEHRAEVEERGGVLVPAAPGTPLHRWLRRAHATAAIVRPDGTVLRAGCNLSELRAALPNFTPRSGRIRTGGLP
jgi:FAD binding domain